MLRYVAVLYDPRDPEESYYRRILTAHLRSSTNGWVNVLTSPQCEVYISDLRMDGCNCATLAGQCGVIVGTLFERSGFDEDSFHALNEIEPTESAAIVRSNGRHLIANYWGSYVAVFRNDDNHICIVRGPVGHLPCFEVGRGGLRVFFSYMPDCVAFGLFEFSINWGHVAGILSHVTHTGETGLKEVTEVMWGECVEISESRVSRSLLWRPHDYAVETLEEIQPAISRMVNTTTRCVRAWVSQHERILHYLSGGLDSSIVLSCLQDIPDLETTCVCHYSEGSNSDERVFARVAARRAKVKLVEILRPNDFRLEKGLEAEVSERPQGYFRRLEVGDQEAVLARETAATAILSGSGGDQLFFRNEPGLTVADYVCRKSFRLGLLGVALDVAHLQGLSIWTVLRAAIANSRSDYQWDPGSLVRMFDTLVNTDRFEALTQQRCHTRPWIVEGVRIPPGKQYHIFTLMAPEPYYFPFTGFGSVDHISPLKSQPLVELCLRVPTYLLSRDGWDRWLVRQAFVNKVPAQILQRQSKGGMEEHAVAVLRKNIRFVKELLLDGFLVRQGLLDRGRLEEALGNRPSGVMKGMAAIFRHLDIETWLRIWSTRQATMRL